MVEDMVREALLIEAHRMIEVASTDAMKAIASATAPTYPPAGPEGTRLDPKERDALLALELSPEGKSAVRKVIANAIASAFFGVFCVVDGVGDPRGWQGPTWLGVDLAAPQRGCDRPMLHDEFYETYWRYIELCGSR